MNTRQRLSSIMRGFKEVVAITLTRKDIETDFQPLPKPPQTSEAEAQSNAEIELARIPDGNELIIAPEYIEDMKSFIKNHHTLDTISVPCFYNNDTCTAIMCVFPRVLRPVDERPFVKDVVALAVKSDKSYVALSEYNTIYPDVVEMFSEDIERLLPASYRDNTSTLATADILRATFPNLNIPTEVTPPFFLEDDGEIPDTKGEIM